MCPSHRWDKDDILHDVRMPFRSPQMIRVENMPSHVTSEQQGTGEAGIGFYYWRSYESCSRGKVHEKSI